MKIELLALPERQLTNLAELVRFFQSISGADWERHLAKFVHLFSGTRLQVPGPNILAEMRQDEEIVLSLKQDDSAENRIQLMRLHQVSYTHLEDIWRLCMGKNLSEPSVSSNRKDVVKQGGAWIARYPHLTSSIVQMLKLTATEHQAAAEVESNDRQSKPLTTFQQDILLQVFRADGCAVGDLNTPNSRVPTQTLDALSARGLLQRSGGQLALTNEALQSPCLKSST